jgi:hypothetical protein
MVEFIWCGYSAVVHVIEVHIVIAGWCGCKCDHINNIVAKIAEAEII